MPKGENGQKIQEITELEWFNKLLNIFAIDWSVSGYFRVKINNPNLLLVSLGSNS